MAIESFALSEADGSTSVSKGYYLSKKILILISCIVVAVIVALILGLSLGLKNHYTKDCDVIAESQKLETCKDAGCKNFTFLQSINYIESLPFKFN
jgi:hypothetical protein